MKGVKVKKGQEEVEVHAPTVISNCGIFTTFQKLLPPEIQVKPGEQYWGIDRMIVCFVPIPKCDDDITNDKIL